VAVLLQHMCASCVHWHSVAHVLDVLQDTPSLQLAVDLARFVHIVFAA